MAAERRARWDRETWAVDAGETVSRPPSHMMLLALKSQAAALMEASELDAEDILEGARLYEAARKARPDWYEDFLMEEAERR